MAPRLWLRSLAVLLCALWLGLAAVLLVGYRPGGPYDELVALTVSVPVLVAAAAVARPPVMRRHRVTLAAAWIGVFSALLVAPLLLDAAQTLARGERLPVLPSAEVAYAGWLGLATTCVFAALGWLARARPAVAPALLLGTALTVAGTVVFGGAALANEQAIRARPLPGSPWGPVGSGLEPPHCTAPPVLGPGALITGSAIAVIDDVEVGRVEVAGLRDGPDERWTASLAGVFDGGTLAYERIGGTARLSEDGGEAREVRAGLRTAGSTGLTQDGPVLAAILAGDTTAVAEEVGLEDFEGAPARHCRRAVDGVAALDAFVWLRWLAGQDVTRPSRALVDWRGELDWWTFADGQLGRATVVVGGYPGDAWESSGIGATLSAELAVLERDEPHPVAP